MRSSTALDEVRKITGMRAVALSAFSSLQVVKPSVEPMRTSSSTRSGCRAVTRR